MDEILELIYVNNNNASHCTDPLCSDVNHRSYNDNLYADIIDICLDSGDYCFSKTKCATKCVPNWNEIQNLCATIHSSGTVLGKCHHEDPPYPYLP